MKSKSTIAANTIQTEDAQAMPPDEISEQTVLLEKIVVCFVKSNQEKNPVFLIETRKTARLT